MKKLLVLVLALCLAALPCLAETDVDAFTSASVNNYFGGMEADALVEAINSYNGYYAIASVNPDGTPNIGFYIYSAVAYEGKYYLQLGLNPNQTTANIDNGSKLVAMYAGLPVDMGNGSYPITGARMNLEKVADADLIAALKAIAPQGTELFYEITLIRPLG